MINDNYPINLSADFNKDSIINIQHTNEIIVSLNFLNLTFKNNE